ncbi:haloacid dehalogenase type II [Salinisphaera sp. T31B1]|uniref:haloacid dehalogenase type II n=1 Tax=Salinisphaera sp. T31B1 TaxID=727963 RepID=UPI003340EA78
MPTRRLVFDVNETLLDLAPLDPVFADLFGDAALRRQWFQSLLHWSTITTLTGEYRDFTDLAAASLDHLAANAGCALSSEQRQRVFDTIATLAPHADVEPALEQLAAHGFSLIALTNSAQRTVDAQFEHAGLGRYFERVLSVDAARRYKPHPDAYGVATQALGCTPDALRLIACHDWDVTGALRAGLAGAYVAREGRIAHDAADTPDIVGADMHEVAERVIAVDGG